MKNPFNGWRNDPRVNVPYWSLGQYFFMFFVLAAISGFHMSIFQFFYDRDMVETNTQLVINVLMGYMIVTAALVTVSISIVRSVSWSRPMRRLSEAAKKITRGDFSVRIAPLRRDGKKDFIEVMFDDFNTMAEELASIETLKTDFIANVSHEIKTPLSIIKGYAAALKDKTLTGEQRSEYLETIVEASDKLSSLVTNILKLNKLENREIMPETFPYNLSEQLRRCALAFEELWERKNIRFTANLDEVTVRCEESMLEIVWNNLLSNAVKFTAPGGMITLSLETMDGSAVVTVANTGSFIDEETQNHVFDKFYQGDPSHSGEGNGLGLALAKKVMEIAGGDIAVHSDPDQGTVFTVTLTNKF